MNPIIIVAGDCVYCCCWCPFMMPREVILLLLFGIPHHPRPSLSYLSLSMYSYTVWVKRLKPSGSTIVSCRVRTVFLAAISYSILVRVWLLMGCWVLMATRAAHWTAAAKDMLHMPAHHTPTRPFIHPHFPELMLRWRSIGLHRVAAPRRRRRQHRQGLASAAIVVAPAIII